MRWLVLIGLLAGCPKRRAAQQDVLDPLLAAADLAWDARANDGLDPVERALQRAYGVRPESPHVAWRLARLRLAKGMVLDDERERVAAFGEARSLAWECVLDDPGVRALEIELGLADALAALPAERQACAVWAAHAWVRWMAEFGAEAAALDLAELDQVVEYSRTTTVDPWLVQWTAALARSIRPAWAGGDRGGAARELEAVARARRDEVSPLADLYLYSARGTESEQDAYRALQEARPDAPEEMAYIARALAAR